MRGPWFQLVCPAGPIAKGVDKKVVSIIGILGALLFVAASLIGGFLIEGYDSLQQFISETYAKGTEYGWELRVFGFIPSGLLLAAFCFLSANRFKSSRSARMGFYGVGIFYGLATVVVSIFPCDHGCNREMVNPSLSQWIHNMTGLLTYLIVPLCILQVGSGVKRLGHKSFSAQSFSLGGLSILFVILLILDANSQYAGLIQRMVESVFLLWIAMSAVAIKNQQVVSKDHDAIY